MKSNLRIRHTGMSCSFKFTLTMKLTGILFLVSVFSIQANSYSQKTRLSSNLEEVKITRVFEKIEKETKFKFLYNHEEIDVDRIVSLKVEKERLDTILSDLFANTDISYIVRKRQIILKAIERTVVNTANPIGPSKNSISKVQEQSVNGTVTDADGAPLPGASIVEKGTTNGTQSDFDGNFSISVTDKNAVLVISYIGFATKEIPLNGQDTISVTLEESAAGLDEVVVVGYGSQSEKKITSAISQVDMAGVKDLPNTTAGEALQGRVSGVTITENNGAPGSSPSIRIRGISSINAGVEPLVVINGFPVGNGMPQSLNPSDIQSVTVLKDAASTSIYGARGSNGVILIETLKAKQSQSELEYNVSSGFQSVPGNWRPETLNAQQYARYNKERVEEINTFSGNSSPVPQIYLDVLNNPKKYGNGTNWQDELFQEALFQNHNIAFRAGNSKIQGVVSGGYLDQKGVLPNTGFTRYSLRTNVNANINKWLKMGSNASISYTEKNSIPDDGNRGVLMRGITASPLQSPYENNTLRPYIPADSPGYFSYVNPLFEANAVTNNTIGRDINANINLDVEILPGLHYKPQIYARLFTQEINIFSPSTIGRFAIGSASDLSPGAPPFVNSASNQKSDITNWGLDNLLTYDVVFGDHSFSALLGYTAQTQTGELSQINASGFPSDNTLNYLEASEISASVSDLTNWSLAAVFSRISYDYKSKYLAELNFRREGSSRFGDTNKYGNFPSGSVGWRVSQEDFFPKDFFINELKLRGSYGITGNSAIGDYDRFGTVVSIPNLNNLDNNFNYVLNNNIVIGKSLNTLGASDLKWETSNQLDLGLSLGFLQDKITLNGGYFRKTTEDMLFDVSLPLASGFASTRANVGKMLNHGWDIEVGANIGTDDFSWNSNLNLSFIKNKVLYIPEEISKIVSQFNITQVGDPVGSLYGFVIDGIFNTQEQLDDPNLFGWTGAKQLGAYIYRDVNGDGTIDELDKDVVGNPHPKVILGFNNVLSYKNLSLSILMTGAFGYQILPFKNGVLYNEKGRWNVSTEFLERWKSTDNPGKGLIPAIYYPGQHPSSNLWVEDGDHIWIKNITIGYKLPSSVLDDSGFLKSLRFYLSIQNAFKFTGYTGWNPQVSSFGGDNVQTLGVDNFSYPISRDLTLGVNINF